MAKLIGYYNRNGYTITEIGDDGGVTEVYSAGNHALDSQEYVAPDDCCAVSLETLAEYCRKTGDELAAERNMVFAGCQQIEDDEILDRLLEYKVFCD